MENLWIACENAKDLYTKNVVYPQVSALHDRRSPRHLTNARESVILGLGGDMRFAAFNSQDLIREMGLAASGFQARFRKKGRERRKRALVFGRLFQPGKSSVSAGRAFRGTVHLPGGGGFAPRGGGFSDQFRLIRVRRLPATKGP